MSVTGPALRGKMGSTTYYQTKLPVSELLRAVRTAKDLDGWATMSIDQRIQREPDTKRILTQIAPYLANSKDRFFGALIVLNYNGEMAFEALEDVVSKVPQAYRKNGRDVGFLTIHGGELIVLDGQHRLRALDTVVKSNIQGECVAELPADEIAMIVIEHESNEKTRRIFNKVNRYAKPTSRGDNIITSEDDGYALVTRMLLNAGAPLGARTTKGEDIVNWKSNTLAPRSLQFTTISAVYETVKAILDFKGVSRLGPDTRPSDDELEEYYAHAEEVWRGVLEGFPCYETAFKDSSKIPDLRGDKSLYSLLFKPAAQVALFKGIILAMEHGKLTLETAIQRATKIDWRMSADQWKNVIIRPNLTIDVRADAQKLAAHLIAYLIVGNKMDKDWLKDFEAEFKEATETQQLPDPVAA